MPVFHNEIETSWLGVLEYREAIELLEAKRQEVVEKPKGGPGFLFLCEHPAVITLGRSARVDDLLQKPTWYEQQGFQVEKTNRGGEITCHGPGQLMVYPVVRLGGGVVEYLQAVAAGIAAALSAYGISASWKRSPAGLWVAERKIASCGLHVRRSVSIHGFAVNVGTRNVENQQMEERLWSSVKPCGMSRSRITSMAKETTVSNSLPSVEELARLTGPLVVSSLLGGATSEKTTTTSNRSLQHRL